jgi:hypothetical protein
VFLLTDELTAIGESTTAPAVRVARAAG